MNRKGIVSLLVVIGLAGFCLTGRAMAKDIPAAELHDFQAFLNIHPEVRDDLQKNPNLVKDARYLQAHSGLVEFFQSHPGIRAAADENPAVFVREAVLYGPEKQPGMEQALMYLQKAEDILNRSGGDKGGHRVKAIELTKQAEREVQEGINYANTH